MRKTLLALALAIAASPLLGQGTERIDHSAERIDTGISTVLGDITSWAGSVSGRLSISGTPCASGDCSITFTDLFQIKDETTALTQRRYATFLGAGVTCADSAGNDATECTIPGGSSSLPVVDTTSVVEGSGDATKEIRFEVDGITTGTIRVLTPPNANITLAGSDFANAWADGIKQTFNPDATNAGINVGSQAGDPSAPANGDIWYDTIANTLDARINGATVNLGAGGSFDALDTTKAWWNEDFYHVVTTIGDETFGHGNWGRKVAGTSAEIASVASEAAHPGIMQQTTGTDATGLAELLRASPIILGGGAITVKTSVNLSALSDATNEYDYAWGFSSGGILANSVVFQYDRNAEATNWRVCTSSSSTVTCNSSGVAVATGWVRLEIRINAGATSIQYFINGTETSGSPITTNIPTTSIYPRSQIIKQAGTTSRNVKMDYWHYSQTMTATR